MAKLQYIASFSGGKDSTAMILKIIELGLPLDRIVFCDTGIEFGEQINIVKIAERKFKELKPGIKFDWIRTEKSFEDYFYTVNTTGKREGQIWGWPFMLGAWCNSRLKMKPLNKYFREIGEHKRYVGIAYDEPKRYKRLPKNCIAPLYELKMTEDDCLNYIKSKGFKNPMYWKFERLGCYLCPKQNLNSLRSLRRHYPMLWEKMLKMDKDSPIPFKADGTRLVDIEERFKREDMKSRKVYPLIEPRLFCEAKQLAMNL
ncbi:MAG: phosphoadenosine phosphosulfate reductase family protein [Veillonella sp.]|uniref:phosphoadenosine phosphosulfate reductase domain-containing protein n=1 Tax=Veillonella sp. TaxID=1926307 RepID=UPI0029068583|nr:phosphoadenosine phosphosulfate reductase family protein [Veillonella sp.]MDU7927962.1 phosphoadenosine phosphosulfate reductase family protein [Veillonella sp.]MDU7955016.1 phosphoadenosine phosphosulfate reductase family protein [Clostridium perfringens]MDU7962763.1 phosphoadenosine phosphosulfate reductase family protein [Clostridium perfringens]